MKQELKKENIAFITKEKKDRIDVILESGVKLIFENDDNSELKLDDYILIGFEFSDFNL